MKTRGVLTSPYMRPARTLAVPKQSDATNPVCKHQPTLTQKTKINRSQFTEL